MTDTKIYEDYPLMMVAQQIAPLIERGDIIHQKYTCGHCGTRQVMEEPNKLFTSGQCEECGQITIIGKCNYMLIRKITK